MERLPGHGTGSRGLSSGALDVHTATPAGTQHTAEHFELDGGRIASIALIFDATPWQSMAAAVTTKA